ncbi:hypothetical protein WN944_023735 [Citrus x changshan-huyou]|uniref:DUF4283 domain-containing protein n=1 Tax=Citrus x changshan-huyou TaxID=2935761 RepID=A0AAP0LM65_9ROSI
MALNQVWQIEKEVKIEKLGDNIFIFKFANEADKKELLQEIKNVPIMCMDEEIYKEIGGFVGRVEEVDIDRAGDCMGQEVWTREHMYLLDVAATKMRVNNSVTMLEGRGCAATEGLCYGGVVLLLTVVRSLSCDTLQTQGNDQRADFAGVNPPTVKSVTGLL